MNDDPTPLGKYLNAGTRVRLDDSEHGPEYGVVVHCWMNEEMHGYDCYVAFFGHEYPVGAPAGIPYILRYASMFLIVLD